MKNYDYAIYFDKVKSRLDLDRKELNNLKEDIENKEYSKIVIKDITQLSRNTIYKEEQDILSRYVGWGGIADAFDER